MAFDPASLQVPSSSGNERRLGGNNNNKMASIGNPSRPGSEEPIVLEMPPIANRFLMAPYHASGVKWELKPYVISLWLEFLGSIFLSWVVSTVASVAVSGSTALNSLSVGLAYGGFLTYFYSWRQTAYLPRHLNPALTWAQLIHLHTGLVVAVPYWLCQYGGSALSAAFLALTGGSAIPNHATALRPVSFWGAMGLELVFGVLLVYSFVQNVSVEMELMGESPMLQGSVSDERSSKYRGIRSTAIISGLAALVGVMAIYPNGLYALGNSVIYFGSAINIGFNVPEAGTWVIYIFWSWLGGIVAYAIHWLTWDVNNTDTDQFRMNSRIVQAYMSKKVNDQIYEAHEWAKSVAHMA